MDVAGNERADEEAKKGAMLWTPQFVTLTHAKRTTKANILKRWTKDWARTLPTGGFGIANKFPPAWKIRKHVQNTRREIFGCLMQSQTRHAFVGEYYAKDILTEEFPELEIRELLGSTKGLEVFATFLDKSGAFTKMGEPRQQANRPRPEDEENDEGGKEGWWERMARGDDAENEDEEDKEESEEEG
ncbi:hypothetical protein DXG03_001634 [Asterophora parasitica]|uniref:Uncharacterized protein n=1 Tax=Asterophora parasitica TaxID=117018 RepID=A0A9P7FX92_9AGAR|nr:hypothetical protein DXG03_001634 [Asterophora parasitica]